MRTQATVRDYALIVTCAEATLGGNYKAAGVCDKRAVVEIDGRPMCRTHGGVAALDAWIAEGRARVIGHEDARRERKRR